MKRGISGRFLKLRGAWMVGAAVACALAAPAMAQDERSFNVPAQDAATAVQEIARQSGLQVMAPQGDLQGVRTNAVQGTYSPVEAMERLVAGTGLEVVRSADGTVTIRRPTAAVGAMATQAGGTAETDLANRSASDIIVTGSRIRRPGYDTLEATLVTDEEQIEKRGYTNIMQALDDTPGFVASGVNPIGTTQGTFNTGQSFADFFGLGSQRTLTLVNGRRFVSSNTVSGSGSNASPGQQVDLNLIPVGLVERIETIAIGGAPIYGSDAIAGTVNIILKDDFEGLELTGQYGITEEGDAPSYTLRALGGLNFANDRGNIAVAAEYNQQKGILLSERTGDRFSLPNVLGGPGDPALIVSRDITFGTMTEGGLPYNPATFGNIVDASGAPLQFASGGTLVPFVTGDPLIPPLFFDGGDGVRNADHLSLLSPTERILLNGFGHFDITPAVRLVAEVSYAHSEGEELSELSAFADPFQAGTFIPISIDNAFLSSSARETLIANGVTDSFILSRNLSDLVETEGHIRKNVINLFRIVGGLEGDFTLFGNPANWDVSFNYGRSRARMTTTLIDNDRFLEAVNAVRSPTGDIVCASGNAGCVPLDIFGVNAFSDEAAEYVTDQGGAVSLNEQRVATANLSGSLPFRISTLPINFNIGAEYRKESGSFDPDQLLSRDYILFGFPYASAYQPGSGSFHTKELYGELSIPIVSDGQDWPVIKSLSADGAIRYVDNSIAGGDITWSAGGRFEPRLPGILDGLLFRGVYTRAIRSPAITELFSGASPTRGGITDPCGVTQYQEGPAPAVREANCRAALDALGITPETFEPTTFALSAIGTVSGNPNLENEKAKSWSVGMVYQPPMIPGFRVAVDWSDIRLIGGIESLGIGTLINACYDSANFPNEPTCDAFRRLSASEVGAGTPNPVRVTGDIANGYRSGFVNVSSLEFSGLIISSEYGFEVGNLMGGDGPGRVQFGAKLLYNDKYIFRETASSPVENDVGSVGLPDWSGQFNAGYSDDRFDFLLQALWTDAVKNDLLAGPDLLDPADNNVGSYWRFNSTIGFTVNESFRLQFVVNNLFDRKPSRAALFSGAFGTYDLLGRRFLATATVGF